jgi:hypothetical protein
MRSVAGKITLCVALICGGVFTGQELHKRAKLPKLESIHHVGQRPTALLPSTPPRTWGAYWKFLSAKQKVENPITVDWIIQHAASLVGVHPDFGTLGTETQQPFFSGADTAFGLASSYYYYAGVQRQPDCSSEQQIYDAQLYQPYSATQVETVPNFEKYLHNVSGLTTKADVFADGCKDGAYPQPPGIATYAGKDRSGDYIIVFFTYRDPNTLQVIVVTPQLTQKSISTVTLANELDGIIAADLNNDGSDDIVALSSDSSGSGAYISVLLGNGDGTFASPSTTSVSGGIGGIVAGDFNGDGKVDLVANEITSQLDNKLLFYAGKGNGTFASPTATDTGSTEHLLTVPVDINGDGKLDILAFDLGSSYSSTQVDMLLGNGNGTFSAKPSLTMSNYSVGPAAFADFNGDGKLDIVIGTPDSILVIGKGAGDGTFTLQSTLPTLYAPHQVYVTDIDGDGNMDIGVGYAAAGAFGPGGGVLADFFGQFVLGEGNFAFSEPARLLAPSGDVIASGTQSIAVADFNGDGKQDVVAAGSASSGSGYVFSYTGNGTALTYSSTSAFTVAPSQISGTLLATADFNGDGKPDVVMVGSDGTNQAAQVGINNGSASFTAKSDLVLPEQAAALATGDFNGDGKQDLALLLNDESYDDASGLNGLYLATGNGDGTFSGIKLLDASVTNGSALASVDVNGDGKQDLVALNMNSVDVYLSQGGGKFAAPIVTELSANLVGTGLLAQDLNGDGAVDLGITSYNTANANSEFDAYKGNKTGKFTLLSSNSLGDYGSATSVAVDVNQDGVLDIVTDGGGGFGSPVLLIGKGGGQYYPSQPFEGIQNVSGVAAISLNGDAYPDLIFGSGSSASDGLTPVINHYKNAPSSTLAATVISLDAITIAQGEDISPEITVKETSGGGVPTGTITATFDGQTVTATLGGGGAYIDFPTANNIAVGSYPINVTYSGDLFNAASTGSATVTVQYATALSFSVNPETITYGSNVTLTGKITRPYGSGYPTGDIYFFYDAGNQLLAKVPLVDGVATLTADTNGYPPGIYDLEAFYYGDTKDADTEASPTDVYVSLVPKGDTGTATSLNISPSAAPQGGKVTATVDVTEVGSSNKPSGKVTLYEYTQAVGTFPITNGKGVVTFTVPDSLYPGLYAITAIYSGNGNVYKSESAAFEFSVLNTTATYLTSSAYTVNQGQSLTISGAVTQYTSYYDLIGGTMTMYADGEALVTVPVTNGSASLTVSTSGIAKGTYNVTARYNGDAHNAPSTSQLIQITVQ